MAPRLEKPNEFYRIIVNFQQYKQDDNIIYILSIMNPDFIKLFINSCYNFPSRHTDHYLKLCNNAIIIQNK